MIRIALAILLFFTGGPFAFAGPLHDAARAGDLEKIRALVGDGVVIDAQSEPGETPLILAILARHGEIAELLIEEGAAVDGRNAGGFTPLHAAAYAGDRATVELLIERGAEVNDAANTAGVSPLFPAIEEDHSEVAELLIAEGADLGLMERHGYTPLTRALLKDHQCMVILLKAHGARMPVRRLVGRCPSSRLHRGGEVRISPPDLATAIGVQEMTDTRGMSPSRAWQVPALAAAAVLAWSACASAGTSVNTGYFGGVAIEGFDTVAYFTDGEAKKGSEEFAYDWLGATWLFANAEHRELFAQQPVKYAPQYGGHCALGTAFGESTANIDPEAWSIVDGKLYLQYSKSGREEWERDRANMIAAADQRWPEVKARLEDDTDG